MAKKEGQRLKGQSDGRGFLPQLRQKSLDDLFTPFAVISTLEPKAFLWAEAVVAAVLSHNSKLGKKTWAKSHFWRLCFPLIDLNTFLSRVRKYTGNKWMYLPVYILWLFSALTGIGQLKAVCREAGVVSKQNPEDEQGSFVLNYLSPSLDLYFTLQIGLKKPKQTYQNTKQKTYKSLKPTL